MPGHTRFLSTLLSKTQVPATRRLMTRFALLRRHDEEKLLLRLERPRQQAFDRGVDRYLPAQDRRHGIRYRHIDILRSRQFDQHRRGEFALRELAARRPFAAPERDAERKVARLRAGAAQDQVAEPR